MKKIFSFPFLNPFGVLGDWVIPLLFKSLSTLHSVLKIMQKKKENPIIPLLQIGSPTELFIEERQALKNQSSRWSRKQLWALNSEKKPKLDQHLILIDDVLTTGATLVSAAEFLKSWGYTRISAWVLGVRPSLRPEVEAKPVVNPKTCSMPDPTP